MDVNELSRYLAQVSTQTQAGQAAGVTAQTGSADFAQMLAAMSGSAESGGSTSVRDYLLSGLMDGSINVPQDTLTSLLDLTQSGEEDWLSRYMAALGVEEESSGDTDIMQQYYQALVAMNKAQQELLGG